MIDSFDLLRDIYRIRDSLYRKNVRELTQDIEALTERILLIGKGKILLDGKFAELKRRMSEQKTMAVQFKGSVPELREEMRLIRSGEGQLTVSFEPSVLTVSDAVIWFAARTEVRDVSVYDISAEEMAAHLYEEYGI